MFGSDSLRYNRLFPSNNLLALKAFIAHFRRFRRSYLACTQRSMPSPRHKNRSSTANLEDSSTNFSGPISPIGSLNPPKADSTAMMQNKQLILVPF